MLAHITQFQFHIYHFCLCSMSSCHIRLFKSNGLNYLLEVSKIQRVFTIYLVCIPLPLNCAHGFERIKKIWLEGLKENQIYKKVHSSAFFCEIYSHELSRFCPIRFHGEIIHLALIGSSHLFFHSILKLSNFDNCQLSTCQVKLGHFFIGLFIVFLYTYFTCHAIHCKSYYTL